MAHKPLIDGTAYEVTGGKTLIDGTAFGIAVGKALVDGTGYDVAFGPKMVTISVTGSDADEEEHAYLTVNGQSYYFYDAPFTLEVPAGTEIYCEVYNGTLSSSTADSAYISVNGTKVVTAKNYGYARFTYIATKDGTIEGKVKDGYGRITITQDDLITFKISESMFCAQEGMIWADWVASVYNTINAEEGAGFVVVPNGDNSVDTLYSNSTCTTEVWLGEEIIAAHAYYLS